MRVLFAGLLICTIMAGMATCFVPTGPDTTQKGACYFVDGLHMVVLPFTQLAEINAASNTPWVYCSAP